MDEYPDIKIKLGDPSDKVIYETVCLFCKKQSGHKLTAINDKKDFWSALSALGIEYKPIPNIKDHMCYQCVYRINVIIDFRRLLERNLNKSRANYFYNHGDNEQCRKYLLLARVDKAASKYSMPSTYSEFTRDLRHELMLANIESNAEQTPDFLFDCFNISNQDYPSPARLLEPMFETSESVLATESGGDINLENHYNMLTQKSKNKHGYKCKFCEKTYKRPHYLRKHERRHKAKLTRIDYVKPSNDITYQCMRCHDEFNTKTLLKNHEKSHRNRIKCAYCTAEFILRHDLELHEARCYGMICARDETASVKTHYTRSRSKPPVQDTGDLDSLYSERMRNVDDWVDHIPAVEKKNDNNDMVDADDDDDDDDNASVCSNNSQLSYFSRFSSVSSAPATSCCTTEPEDTPVTITAQERFSYYKPKSKTSNCDNSSHSSSVSSDSLMDTGTSKSGHSRRVWCKMRKIIKRQIVF